MRVLLVDDSKVIRGIQRKVLEGFAPGSSFTEAGDAPEALAAIGAAPEPFDLVLIEWGLPGMDGLALAARIRATDRRTPLVMCTTEAGKDRVMQALKAGVNNYVVKPFTPETLAEKVKQTLERSRVCPAPAA